MSDEKKALQNSDIAEVNGGITDQESAPQWVPYTNKNYPVRCPKCKSHNILWDGGFLWFEETINYLCDDCMYSFSYNDLPDHGASNDW